MNTFIPKKSVTGALILAFLFVNAELVAAKDDSKIQKDCQKVKMNSDEVDRIKEIKQVELPDKVKILMESMGGEYKMIADSGVLTVEDIETLRKLNKFNPLIIKIIDLYKNDRTMDKETKEFASFIDQSAQFMEINFGMSLFTGHPYIKGTRYAVFSLEDALKTYN
jgi:hypothetical protein